MSSWTKEREDLLLSEVGEALPVSQEIVALAATVLEVSTRSISSKLRKMGVDVERVTAKTKKFTDEEAETLVNFLEAHSGEFTYVEIAEQFEDGKFSNKQIQGKILSLELTDSVKAAPKKVVKKVYSDEEEATFIEMANAGKYLEDIAEVLNKTLASVRGKALSLNRTQGLVFPKQKQSHAAEAKVDVIAQLIASGELADMTVEEIAEKSGKSTRGVRTIISRRETFCADYKGKSKNKKED